jgi:hypothetical protein
MENRLGIALDREREAPTHHAALASEEERELGLAAGGAGGSVIEEEVGEEGDGPPTVASGKGRWLSASSAFAPGPSAPTEPGADAYDPVSPALLCSGFPTSEPTVTSSASLLAMKAASLSSVASVGDTGGSRRSPLTNAGLLTASAETLDALEELGVRGNVHGAMDRLIK